VILLPDLEAQNDMRRLIFVLLDGLSARTARTCMGYLEALREAGTIFGGSVLCELPARSRPLYHCLVTGRRPAESGLVHNSLCIAPNPSPSCFHLARERGRTTAAAAFFWFSELLNAAPFVPERDRLTVSPDAPVQYGLFYSPDSYPDAQTFEDAEALRVRHDPHLLLIHCLGADPAGHRRGLGAAYRNAVRESDMLLARFMPHWLARGYQVMITGDHGMSADRQHNGTESDEREVPVYLAGDAFRPDAPRAPAQSEWCGTLCEALGLREHGKALCRDVLASTSL
jgi:predicted AlkP superfamily pyrophosphatase or phosphodiesterase